MAVNFNNYLKENYSDSEIADIRIRAKEKGKMKVLKSSGYSLIKLLAIIQKDKVCKSS